jgi:prepilin-type N-terminal cleavage/methylation domain-containing protein
MLEFKYIDRKRYFMKKGFTLIELLSVIVILAIIALITAPIILNSIKNSRNNAALRSAEFYLESIELSIANLKFDNRKIEDGTYKIMNDGNVCLEFKSDNKTCIREISVDVKGKRPENGTITINEEKITDINIIINQKEVVQNSKGEMVLVKTLEDVCELKYGTAKTAGSKYACKVDPERKPYIFYVLSHLLQQIQELI